MSKKKSPVWAKSKPVQKLTKEQMGKQPLKESNKAVARAMTNVNPKYAAGKAMLTSKDLRRSCQYYMDLHNFYINNHMMLDSIVLAYRKHHFLYTDDIFAISFGYMYDLFNLGALDISLIGCYTL
jgi:hypothetical protein